VERRFDVDIAQPKRERDTRQCQAQKQFIAQSAQQS
jgi:hypothetical protein